MLNIANTQDSNGDYLFAGFSAGAKPFTQTNAGFNYAGAQGQRLLQIGPTRQIAVSASGAYQADAAISFNGIQTAVSGTPAAGDSFTIAPSANQDVFTTLKNLSDALSRGTVDAAAKAQVGNDIIRAMVDIDRAMEKFSGLQA